MDNSLIPRAFSPTDAKRRAEENAREAERRSSARNTSSASIPDGGTLTLAGGIDVVDGGVVDVIGNTYDSEGAPYAVHGTFTTVDVETNFGTGAAPAFTFSTDIFGLDAKARIYTTDGRDLNLEGSQVGSGRGSAVVSQEGFQANFGDDGAAYGNSTGKYREAGLVVGRYGFNLKFSDGANGARSAIVADGNGNVDIQTTGALTQNGAPITGGGGSGAVSSVAGRTGDVVLAKADVGLSNVDNTADVDKPISTKTQAALDGKVNTGPQHAEFTLTNVSVPSGGPTAAYTATFVPDAANTTGAAFATTPAPGKIGLPAGTYAVHHFIDCGATMGTGAVVAIADSGLTKRYGSLDIVAGSWNASVNHPCIYLPAATNITPAVAQFSGTTRSASVRVYIEKIK